MAALRGGWKTTLFGHDGSPFVDNSFFGKVPAKFFGIEGGGETPKFPRGGGANLGCFQKGGFSGLDKKPQ